MKPVLTNYTNAIKHRTFYTQPKIIAHKNDITYNTKTCIYKSPCIKASFIKLKTSEQFLDSSNYNSSLYYIIEGKGTLNSVEFSQGDVICTNKFSLIKSKTKTCIYNVDDSPLMDYYNVSGKSEKQFINKYSNTEILDAIDDIDENTSPNRLGVIFGTSNDFTSVSNSMWCLMTKTLPYSTQPPHKHNSIALDYCVSGEGYTLLSKSIKNDKLVDPIKIDWTPGIVFVTPPGWWHSHHSTSSKEGFIFPVQDAGLHIEMDTLGIEFI